ncbi:periplasmic heavy metal sensor [Herminiimonas sp. CN]|uniref:periplasmic heavy metal sensor n=1 Tax=Herminiimonas sp. CN TaxID=1349818 RepID=UPI0004730DA2|nr:periplasmic heavy metal sensor [Herminiimonas sp. CN]
MKRSTWIWILAASLSLNLGFAATVAYKQLQQLRSAPAAPGAQGRPASLPDQLQLSAGQRSRWQQAEHGFVIDLAANWRDIRQHREALIRQIFSAQPERAKIDAEQTRIAQLQDAQQRRVIAQLLEERDLLDQRQRAALMALLLARYANEATEEELLHRDR